VDEKAVDWFFQVTDTGVGLSADQIDKLFQPFVQADNSTTRQFGGTGLGLALSRRLAHLMGGDVYVLESTPGKGSTFEIRIRCTVLTPLAEKVDPQMLSSHGFALSHSLDGLEILVVEDSPDNQYLLKRMLSEVGGAHLDFADNGKEGVEKALSGNHNLVLMDLQMPLLDGFAATSMLRSRKFMKPILALTANAMNEDRERCFQVGFNDYLMKPINQQELFDKVLSHGRAH
jgi:CheY-like chemotaxis protein